MSDTTTEPPATPEPETEIPAGYDDGQDHIGLPHHTTTGLSNTKLAMWLFLGSECLLFGGLISTYMLYRNRQADQLGPDQLWDIPFTSATSFVLLMSSLTMVLAVTSAQRSGTWISALAGGLGAGGKGMYILDVTSDDPQTDKVLFELTGKKFGHIYGRPRIARRAIEATDKTVTYPYYVIAGNGYGSDDGKDEGNEDGYAD